MFNEAMNYNYSPKHFFSYAWSYNKTVLENGCRGSSLVVSTVLTLPGETETTTKTLGLCRSSSRVSNSVPAEHMLPLCKPVLEGHKTPISVTKEDE
jgi:hypothetical protein